MPIAWFFIDDVPEPPVVRRSERPVEVNDLGRMERVDGGLSRGISILEAHARRLGLGRALTPTPATSTTSILSGRFRMTQGDHVIERRPG